MRKLSVLIGALVLASSQMAAAENYYVGAQYAQSNYEQSGVPSGSRYANGESSPSALMLIGGYQFNENVAIEGRFGFNLGDDDFEFAGNNSSVKTELSSLFSILGKFSLGGDISPYALIGFTDYELDAENSDSVEGNGLSFGAGVDFKVSENASISLEYVNYVSADLDGGGDADLTALSLGVNYSF